MSPPAVPQPRRRTIAFWGLVGLILLTLPVAAYLFLRRAPVPSAPAMAAAPVVEDPVVVTKPVTVRLAEFEGTVERRRRDGSWERAAKGDLLERHDAVRTRDGAVAVLVGGEAWEVRMEPGTEVSVDDLTESISRLLLQNGMATATVKGAAKHTFEVRSSGSDALATTTEGTFAISNNGAGTVAVGTREGAVTLSGSGKVVIVRAGQQSVVRPGTGPSEPAPIPSSLLLKVKWPQRPLLTRKRLVVVGAAAPGSHVEVSGQVVHADAEGRFEREVELAEGTNQIQVRALSVGGVRADEGQRLQVDTRPPKTEIDRDIWGTGEKQ